MSESTNEPPTVMKIQPIPGHHGSFITWHDPVVQERTESSLPSKQERKENLDNLFVTCSNAQCGKAVKRAEIKVCSRCKTARYCSQACQKVDWKAGHKQDCGTGTGSTKELSLKLAERSLSVPDVTHFLAHASILLLELVQKPLNWRNYVIKAVCKTQDADLQAYIQRALSQQPPDENAQVCLFYSALEKVPFDEAPKLTKLTAKRKEESFRKNLRDMDGDLTHGENPIVTYFVTNQNGDGADGAVSLSLVIPMGEVMRMAVTKKLQYRSAMRGEFEVDMSVKNLLEGLNNFIRMDKQNKLRLRGYPNGSKTPAPTEK